MSLPHVRVMGQESVFVLKKTYFSLKDVRNSLPKFLFVNRLLVHCFSLTSTQLHLLKKDAQKYVSKTKNAISKIYIYSCFFILLHKRFCPLLFAGKL